VRAVPFGPEPTATATSGDGDRDGSSRGRRHRRCVGACQCVRACS